MEDLYTHFVKELWGSRPLKQSKNGGLPDTFFVRCLDFGYNCDYSGAAEPPVRCGGSHLSGLSEPPR